HACVSASARDAVPFSPPLGAFLPRAAVDGVVPVTSRDDVAAGATVERVATFGALERVALGPAAHGVVPAPTRERVVARLTVDRDGRRELATQPAAFLARDGVVSPAGI